MGYELTRFQGDVDEELICPICAGVLEEPLQVNIFIHTTNMNILIQTSCNEISCQRACSIQENFNIDRFQQAVPHLLILSNTALLYSKYTMTHVSSILTDLQYTIVNLIAH